MAITIHPELHSLIPALTPEEFAQLEANLLADGCHDPLMVWQEEQTLLDGHNRYAVCERHGLRYTTQGVSLADLDAAKAWMIASQLGRRNLTPAQMSYFRGKQYEIQKRQGARTDITSPHNDGKSRNTAQVLADQHQVGQATIERDGAYARAVDTLAEVVGPEARQALLAREAKLTQQEVKQLADVAKVSPNTAKEVMATVPLATTPQAAKRIVQNAVESLQRTIAAGGSGLMADAGAPSKARTRLAPKPAAPPPKVAKAGLTAAVQEVVPEQASPHTPSLDLASNGPEVPPQALFNQYVEAAVDNIQRVERYCRTSPAFRQHHPDHCRELQDACGRLLALLTPQEPTSSAVGMPVDGASGASGASALQGPMVTREEAGSLIMAIYLTVQRLQPCTCVQVAKALDEKLTRVHQALHALVQQGKVRKEDKTYSVVDAPVPACTRTAGRAHPNTCEHRRTLRAAHDATETALSQPAMLLAALRTAQRPLTIEDLRQIPGMDGLRVRRNVDRLVAQGKIQEMPLGYVVVPA